MQINGLVLGKYRIEKLINNGSFASVFLAKEELTNRIVAIKALPKSVYPSGRFRYLLAELSAMTLNWGHQNIVSIHTVEPGEDEYVAYIVMEYVDGSTLHEQMSADSLSPGRAVNIALDICRGLTAVHAQNIIHRDIKPQNILLTSDDTAKLTDFGVACILEATNDIAATVTGTRKYMAPEQYDGEYDYRVDLYSLGLVLFEMVTGRFPFWGRTHDEIKMKKLGAEVEFDDEVPDELHVFLQKVLHRNVDSRHQTAAEMYQDLDTIRSSWYAKTVREVLAESPDQDRSNAKLSKTRKELRLSADLARRIELEVQYHQRTEEERHRQHRLEQESSAYYDRAEGYIRQKDLIRALRELQEAHSLYVRENGLSIQAERIFQSVTEWASNTKIPSKADEIARLIEQLPPNEVEDLVTRFTHQHIPISAVESSNGVDSVVTDMEEIESGPQPTTFTDSSLTEPHHAESILRSLHENTK
ncbi:MAG: serine/threonine-protein kinase, partial [Candidatus Poribacteria bacterium]|nr:serine/threonine-protein kinase [Candidatus Poribacteria bacterium]